MLRDVEGIAKFMTSFKLKLGTTACHLRYLPIEYCVQHVNKAPFGFWYSCDDIEEFVCRLKASMHYYW